MTKVQCKSELETQAKYWLWRIEQGLSQQERQAFVAWANQDNSHHKALHKYSSTSKTSKVLNDFNGLFPLEKKVPSNTNSLYSRLSLAASVIFISFLTSTFFFNNDFSQFFQKAPTAVVYQQFSTSIGEQKSFNLPDGSLVQLNTNSLLTISFSGSHRQLNLIKGEALFEVSKDKSRPFSVSAGQQSFTALGTIFNVQINDNNQLELIVTEGRVLIADSNESLPRLIQEINRTEVDPQRNNIIVAGEKAIIINKRQLPVNKISRQALLQELAWQKGMLIFDGETLTTALDEVSRYNDINFVIEDKKLAQIKVAGYFRAGDVKALLDSLSYNFDLEYKEVAHNTIIINKANIVNIQVTSSASTL